MPGLQSRATETDVKQAERDMEQELIRRARSDLKGVNSASEVHVRDILPDEDLNSGDGNGWDGTPEWAQNGLAATSASEVYEIDSSDLAEGKVIGIFAISSQSGSPDTSEITFEDGTGSTFERLMFQEYNTYDEGEYAMLRNPVIVDEGKDAVITQHNPTDSSSDDDLVYHGLVAEKAGTTLGTRSRGEPSGAGTMRQGGR